MTRKLAALAALIVFPMTALVGTTAGCDLTIEQPGVSTDTADSPSNPGSPTMMGPADAPEHP